MTVVTLVGARPQFIKAAPVSRALEAAGIEEVLVHSGQHYDRQVSDVFFDELGLPVPATNLDVGSGTHAQQTGAIMERFESWLAGRSSPDWILLYGDTNTTLAGALVAAKLHLPIAHIEAGLRSFNRQMPEEINRIVTDRLASLLFCPTQTAQYNLSNEGIHDGVHVSGDVMYDATMHFSRIAEGSESMKRLDEADSYFLATVHRPANTDAPGRLEQIIRGLGALPAKVVLPVHPRTRAGLQEITLPASVELCDAVGYLEMLMLIKGAKAVITDSGGLQKEAYWLGRPCITLREETEWLETLDGGWNQLVGADPEKLHAAVRQMPDLDSDQKPFGVPETGTASALIAQQLLDAE